MALVVSTGATSTPESSPASRVVDRINYGVVFKQEQDLLISREHWLHTFHIVLPKRFKLTKVPSCNVKYQCNSPQCDIGYDCRMLHTVITQIHNLHQSLFSDYNETMKEIRTLIPQTNLLQNGRQKRSLLPFIGNLYKGLFGLATMNDVNILASHINEIAKRTNGITKALEQHNKHLSSFISLTDKRMTNLMKGIKNNNNLITNLVSSMDNKFQTFQHTVLNISSVILNQVDQTNILRGRLNRLGQAVQSLVQGRVTPHLISKQTLSHVLHTIKLRMRKHYSQFYLTHLDPSFYYSHGKFVYARNHSSLYVTLKFPLSSLRLPLNLYKVISLPVPVHHNSTTSKHATQLLSLPDYFAITPHHDHFLPLSATDLINCQHDSVMLCDINLALSPITVPDCTMALFSNNGRQIHQLCNFRFTQNLLQPNIIELSATTALVYNSKNLVLDCVEEKKIIPGCAFCIVNIPCRCSLSTDSLYFSPRLVSCYNSSTTVTVVHPVNLALLQQFFDDSKLDSIFGDTRFPKPINFTFPQFQFYNHTFSDVLANDRKDHLSLTKIAKAVKKDQKIFHNLAEPLLDGLIEIPQSWPDFNSIIAFSAIAIAVISICISIFMCCKVRKMTTALLLMQQVQSAVSSTVPSFVFKVESPTTASVTDSIISEFSWMHASVIVGAIVFIIMLIVLVLMCKSKTKRCTFLALELTTGGDCAIVPIIHLSLCPSNYKISKPRIRDVTLAKFTSMELNILWSPFTVTDKRTGTSISVPGTISLNPWLYFRVKRIIKQPYFAYALLIHDGYAFSLNED